VGRVLCSLSQNIILYVLHDLVSLPWPQVHPCRPLRSKGGSKVAGGDVGSCRQGAIPMHWASDMLYLHIVPLWGYNLAVHMSGISKYCTTSMFFTLNCLYPCRAFQALIEVVRWVLLHVYSMCMYVQWVYSQGMAPGEAGNAGEGTEVEILTYPKVDMFWE
jgi:hypothetical protein